MIARRRAASFERERAERARALRSPDHLPLKDHARVTSSQRAAQEAEVVVLSVHWPAAESAVAGVREQLAGKILVDCTNAVGADLGPQLSAAEQIQAWAPECVVVKSFNQIGFNIMADPVLEGRRAVLFVAGDSAEACKVVAGLAAELDFDPVVMPSLSYARQLEALAMIWISMSYKLGHGREFAFSMLRRS